MIIFADTADLGKVPELALLPAVGGFTTNPTLMRQRNVRSYREFALELLALVPHLPVSLEVISDTWVGMNREARVLSGMGKNVYVKIPVTNTRGESSGPLVRSLTADGVKVNVTAVFTVEQALRARDSVLGGTPAIVSLFAGRVADTGRDPEPIAREISSLLLGSSTGLLWASAREVFNCEQAGRSGCRYVTLPPDLIQKLSLKGKSLETFSLETVQMFAHDAEAAGYRL